MLRTLHAWLLLLSALCCGCTAFLKKSDYYDYRAIRLERDDHAKLLAMQRYTARHPSGHFYDEVQRARQARDQAVFEAGKSDRAGLELYLAAFPDGNFAEQAKSRLAVVAVIEERKREEQRRAEHLVEERKQHEAELARTWVTRFFAYWAKTLLALRNWGAPIEQLAHENPDFSRAFARPPRPSCTEDECVKYYQSAFAVPVPGGTRIERSMRLTLRLRLEQGKVTRAELLFPGAGFSRWRELEERAPVVDGDVEARKHAVEWAFARVMPLLEAIAPERKALDNYVMKEIPKPAINSSGELVDTTAEDPAAPANQIQGEARAPEPTVGELVKPVPKERAPDMELGPIQVGKDGRPMTAAPQPAAPNPQVAPGDAPVLEMAPLAVPRAEGSANAAPAPATAGATTATPVAAPAIETIAPEVKAFQTGSLRVVVFAAGSGAKSPAYDGLLIELAADARARRQDAKRRAPPPAVTPQAGPAPAPSH